MDALNYVIQSLVWSMLGFAGGFFFGRAGREVHQIKEVVVTENDDEPTHAGVSDDRWRQAFGVALIALALATVTQAWYNVEQRRDTVECQVRYNVAMAEAFKARTQYAESDREALVAFFRVPATSSDRIRREAYFDLVETYQRNDRLREKHPLPTLPQGDCR